MLLDCRNRCSLTGSHYSRTEIAGHSLTKLLTRAFCPCLLLDVSLDKTRSRMAVGLVREEAERRLARASVDDGEEVVSRGDCVLARRRAVLSLEQTFDYSHDGFEIASWKNSENSWTWENFGF